MKQLLLIILSVFSATLLPAQATWTSLGGPLGADATAFYADEDGNYWLGTGSSGGVYVSNDYGNTWKPVNDGIGTVHVSWIGELDGQLYIEIFDAVQAVQTNFPFRCYQYQKEANSWERIEDDERNKLLIEQMRAEVGERNKRMEEQFPLSYGDAHIRKEAIINSSNLSSDGMEYKRVLGFSNTLAGNSRYKQTFPRDAYQLRSGNLYEDQTGGVLMLSRSGVYMLQGYDFRLLGDAGLEAADVSHVANVPGKGTYAIVNRQDIFYRLQGHWYPVYKAVNMPSDEIFVEYSQRINRHANGKVLTCMQGHIWGLEETVSRLLQPRTEIVDKEVIANYQQQLNLPSDAIVDGYLRIYYANAAYDSDGSIWAVALIKTKNDFLFDGFLAHIKSGEKLPELKRITGLTRYGMVTKNPKNKEVWLFASDHAERIDSEHEPTTLKSLRIHPMMENNIAIFSDGRMACYTDGKLHLWDADEEQLSIIPTKSAKPLSIQCIGFGSNGQLYAGTGYDFLPPGFCGASVSGEAKGLFYLNGQQWMPVENPHPNPWILAVAPAHDGGIVVGTSGSSAYHRNVQLASAEPLAYTLKESNGKFGMVDADDDWIVPQEYDNVYEYGNGIFAFAIEGEFTVYRLCRVDEEGSVSFAPNEAQKLTDIGGGYFLLGEDGDVQIIDSDMLPVIKGIYERYTYDYAQQVVLHGNVQDVLMHKIDNQWHIKKIARKIEELKSIKGWLINENGKFGIFEKDASTVIIPQEYDSLHIVNELIVAYKNGEVGAMSVYTQEWMVPLKYKEVTRQGNFLTFKKGALTSIVHSYAGSEPIGEFDFITDLGEKTGLYKVRKNGLWGLLKEKNGVAQKVLPAEYNQIMGMSSTQSIHKITGDAIYDYLLLTKNDKKGVFSTITNKQVIPITYDDIELAGAAPMPEEQPLGGEAPIRATGGFRVKQGTGLGFYDIYQKALLVPTNWEDVHILEGNPQLFEVQKDGKWGLFDSGKKQLVVPAKYDGFSVGDLGGNWAMTRMDGKVGLLSMKDFREVLAPSYQKLIPFNDTQMLLQEGTKHSLFNIETKTTEAIPELSTDFEQKWQVANDVLPADASIRADQKQVWLSLPQRKQIMSLDVNSGKERVVISSSAMTEAGGKLLLNNGKIAFSDGKQQVFSYSEMGAQRWVHVLGYEAIPMPVMGKFGAGGKLQVALFLTNGEVVGFDWETGEEAWKYQTGVKISTTTYPIALDMDGDQIDELVFQFSEETEGDCKFYNHIRAIKTADGSSVWDYTMNCQALPGSLLGFVAEENQILTADGSEIIQLPKNTLNKMVTTLGAVFDPTLASFTIHPNSQVVYGVESPAVSARHVPYIVCTPSSTTVSNDFEDTDGMGDFDAPEASQLFLYHIGKVSAQPFIADILGTGTPQVGFVSENGLLLLLDEQAQLAKIYSLPAGVYATPWVGDADGDGNNDLIISDRTGAITFYKGKNAGKVVWGEYQGNGNASGVVVEGE